MIIEKLPPAKKAIFNELLGGTIVEYDHAIFMVVIVDGEIYLANVVSGKVINPFSPTLIVFPDAKLVCGRPA